MPRLPKYTIKFAPEVIDHLDAIDLKYHRLIQKSIDEQLRHTPEIQTRNRKPVEQPAPYNATWELRFGANNRFRVFYEVETEERIGWVLAIGVKEGNRLFIGGEEFIS